MKFFQDVIQTYDNFAFKAGEYETGKTPLVPLAHNNFDSDIEVTLDATGNFITAKKLGEDDKSTIHPETELSTSRTSGKVPHPLCDKLEYLTSTNTDQYGKYINQLEEWNRKYPHPILNSVLMYIKKDNLLDDLVGSSIKLKQEKGVLKLEEKIRWRVDGIDSEESRCWVNKELIDSYQHWYLSSDWEKWYVSQLDDNVKKKYKERKNGFCMISGAQDDFITNLSPVPMRKIPGFKNAKLFSSNDTDNFSFKGRFMEANEASTISYKSCQKFSNALSWLGSNDSTKYGEVVLLCWNPNGKKVPSGDEAPWFEDEKEELQETSYKDAVKKKLKGWAVDLPDSEEVIIATFKSATTGRMALTYYNNLKASDYLARLEEWDTSCCWLKTDYENKKPKVKISSPSLWDILKNAYWSSSDLNNRSKTSKVNVDKIITQRFEELLNCRISKAKFPIDIERTLVERAKKPEVFDYWAYQNLLFVTCSAIRKYHYDHMREEIKMALDKDYNDRSYQFGRLMAVFEKLERDTYDSDSKYDRKTNAFRYFTAFSNRPLKTANMIHGKLVQAYIPKLDGKSQVYYQKLLGEIFDKINSQSTCDDLNKPLEDLFLVGFYLQLNELYKPNKNTDNKE